MNDTPLIKRQVTADRGKVLLTTLEVTAVINRLEGEPFTTRDISKQFAETWKNIDHARIEYSVRASIHWLIARGRVRRVGDILRTDTTCYPYMVTLYQSVPVSEPVDFATLYRALGV